MMTPAANPTAAAIHRTRSGRIIASKVAEVTGFFWLVKILTTGMGETASDFLTHRFDPVLAAGCAAVVLVLMLTVQFCTRRYVTSVYWSAVAMVSVFGTMAADAMHIAFGIPYLVSTIFLAVLLAIIFLVWYRAEKTLSIHSITSHRRELFYWATILVTFALGTAAGDLMANTLGLGYLGSGLLFTVLIALPAVGYWRFNLNAVVAFWSAYIVTRPLGASFADWLAVPAARGGLDWGTGPVTLALTALIIGIVAYLAISGRDSPVRKAAERDGIGLLPGSSAEG